MDQATRSHHTLVDFAELYADRNELDYAVLAGAAKTGRVRAQTGPAPQ